MQSTCPSSCNFCLLADDDPCRRVNETTVAKEPGSIVGAFDAMRTSFPDLEPTVLSKDPPVQKFGRFVSASDARRLIALCEPRLASSTVGVDDAQKHAQTRQRTSSTCWCSFPGCVDDDAVQRLLARVSEVTGTPAVNAESLQMVRYHVGEYYASHHDMAALPHTPQGARLFTLMVYLNNVAAGGATRFTDLDFEVTPSRGAALLWSSLSDADPTVPELRTHHEARPVLRGVKWIANVWIHQHSFMEPLRRGCTRAMEWTYSIEYFYNSLRFYHAAREARGLLPPPKCDGMATAASACAKPSYCCLVLTADTALAKTRAQWGSGARGSPGGRGSHQGVQRGRAQDTQKSKQRRPKHEEL